MNPRIPLFQRKGAAPSGAPTPPEKMSDMDEPGIPMPGEPATCPSCGCSFDPVSGEIVSVDAGDMGVPAPEPMMDMGGAS